MRGIARWLTVVLMLGSASSALALTYGGGRAVEPGTSELVDHSGYDIGTTDNPLTCTATVSGGSVVGTKTNNAAAISTDNVGALTSVASASDPTWTTGRLVALSVDLAGYVRSVVKGTVTAILSTAAKGTTVAGSPTSTAASADRQPLDVTLRRSDGTATGDVTTPLVVAGAVTTSGTTTVVGAVQSYHGSTAGILYNSGVVANGAEILSGCLDTSKIDLLGIVVTNSDAVADRFVTIRFYDTTTCTNLSFWGTYATATKAMSKAFSFGLGSTGPSAWDSVSGAYAAIKLPPGVKVGLTAQGSSNGQVWVW